MSGQEKKSIVEQITGLATDSFAGTAAGGGLEMMQRAENATWGNAALADELGAYTKGSQALGILGVLGGGMQMWNGVEEWGGEDNNWGRGAVDIAAGGASAGSGLLSLFGPAATSAGIAVDAGGVAAAAGVGGAATAASIGPALGVFAAAAALGQHGNDTAEETGWLGQNLDRTNMTFSDVAANTGDNARQAMVDKGMNENLAWALGLGVGATAVVPSAIGAAGLGLYGLGASGVELGSDMIDGASGLAGDAWDCASGAWDSMF